MTTLSRARQGESWPSHQQIEDQGSQARRGREDSQDRAQGPGHGFREFLRRPPADCRGAGGGTRSVRLQERRFARPASRIKAGAQDAEAVLKRNTARLRSRFGEARASVSRVAVASRSAGRWQRRGDRRGSRRDTLEAAKKKPPRSSRSHEMPERCNPQLPGAVLRRALANGRCWPIKRWASRQIERRMLAEWNAFRSSARSAAPAVPRARSSPVDAGVAQFHPDQFLCVARRLTRT